MAASAPVPPDGILPLLLVEDNPGDARLVQELLADLSAPRYDLAHRSRLAEAERYLQGQVPEAILLDLGLPDAYGLDALDSVRKLAVDVPVVVLTSRDDEGLAHQALSAGAQDYLVKGRFDGENLVRAIRYSRDRQRREAALRASEARNRSLLEACLIGLALADSEGRIQEANQAFLDLLGSTHAELEEGRLRWAGLVPPEDQARHLARFDEVEAGRSIPPWEADFQKRDGHAVPVLLGAAGMEDKRHGVVLYAMDISERKAYLDQLQREARQDALTGLKNRRALFEDLEPALVASHRYGHPLCLALCDLDHFKQVNDRFGHGAGDEVLKAFGDILAQEIRGDDVSARLGGDEFCILFPHTPSRLALWSLERVRRILEQRRFGEANGTGFSVSATFGLVDLPPGIKASEGLLQRADEALYRAKQKGRNQIETIAWPEPSSH